MAVQNDFLPFAVGAGANVLTQAQYAALSAIANGYSSGVAQSSALNKTWRQSSIMAAVISSFIVAQTGQAAIDDGTTATLLANFTQAVVIASKQRVIQADTGTANSYAAANTVPLTALPTASGVVQTVQIAHANTGASTYAPDGLAAKPIYGLGGQPLQGSELPANGIATLVSYVGPLLNGGNLCWVLYECIGGAQQVGPGTASNHAVQFGQVAGVVGSVRNLVMNVATVSASATVTADEIIVESALGGLRYCLANFNKTINLATTGAGGMDSGTAPVSGYVALYAIYNPTTQTAALLATNATSAVAPNVYGGANMPSGYTASGLISVWPTNASGLLGVAYQNDRVISIGNNTVLSTSTVQSTYTALSIAGAVPKNAKFFSGGLQGQTSQAAALNLGVAATIAPTGVIGMIFNSAGNQGSSIPFVRVAISNPQTTYYAATNSAGTPTFTIIVSSYEI